MQEERGNGVERRETSMKEVDITYEETFAGFRKYSWRVKSRGKLSLVSWFERMYGFPEISRSA